MKFLRLSLLIATAAVTAVGVLGVSSAMAESTALCKVDEAGLNCAAANLVTSVHFVASDPTIITSLGTFLCESALLAATALGLGAPQVLHYVKGQRTYTSCKLGGTACTVEETTSGGLVDVLKLGTELADVTLLGVNEIGLTEINMHCGAFINCTYGSAALTGHALGPLLTSPESNGNITYTNAVLTSTGGFLCPKEAKLNAVFVSLVKAYIRG